MHLNFILLWCWIYLLMRVWLARWHNSPREVARPCCLLKWQNMPRSTEKSLVVSFQLCSLHGLQFPEVHVENNSCCGECYWWFSLLFTSLCKGILVLLSGIRRDLVRDLWWPSNDLQPCPFAGSSEKDNLIFVFGLKIECNRIVLIGWGVYVTHVVHLFLSTISGSSV